MSRQLCEQAALYALGVLDGEELELYEQHIGEGCPVCQEEIKTFKSVIDQLGWNAASVSPPPSLRQKILTSIQRQVKADEQVRGKKMKEAEANSGLTFVWATDETWKEVLPGIFLKPLYMDRQTGRISALARMTPGSSYKAHRHTAPEEFFVLEGSCFIGGQLLHVGDYHRAEVGSVHHETSSQEGCLMLTIFSPNNEILQTTNT